MNGKELLNKIELIDPSYIEAADKPRRKKPLMLPQWGALAACVTIAVISGVFMFNSPDSGTNIAVSPGDTASLFSSGGIQLAIMLLSLLAAAAILAYIIAKKHEKK